ncbi:MAG TPA: DJ-1/PfpI family protein [Euzebyales bacterium]|nr:DJ-1/PfpI family protein [Euzebyales bacterium]
MKLIGGRSAKTIALVAYPGCSLLELVGAQTIWATASMMSSLKTVVVGPSTEFMATSTPLPVAPQASLADAPEPDVLFVVGGGDAAEVASDDEAVVEYVRRAARHAAIVASTGTGSLILAAAGLLQGRTATTHWAFGKRLEEMGVTYRRASYVEDGRFVTGGGASSAIDLSLLLIARLRGQRLARRTQIVTEWDPAPPFGRIDWAAVDAAPVVASRNGDDRPKQRVALVIYDGLTVLDLVGPLEVMSALAHVRPEFTPVVVAEDTTPVRGDSALTFRPNASLADVPAPDVVIVPGGGMPTLRAMRSPALRRYIRSAAATADYTTSVCTGALLLASVGLLEGRDATTHWAYRRYLPAFGARYVQQRWVGDDGIINSAGVSAGIDTALFLAAQLTDEATARQVQLALHYDPDPPFGGIDYDRLPPLMRAVRALMGLTVPLYTRKPRRMLQAGA